MHRPMEKVLCPEVKYTYSVLEFRVQRLRNEKHTLVLRPDPFTQLNATVRTRFPTGINSRDLLANTN